MEKTRIATVKATGKRYVVNQLDFRESKAHCWGEVVEVKQKGRALQTRHDGQKTFLLDAVDISEVDRTPELLRSLFQQHVDALREKGHVITGRGRRLTDHGTQAQVGARQRARARSFAELAPLLALAQRAPELPTYREPPVTQGPDMPIPEARPEVLEKIVDRLAKEGAFLQRYSNGEFTASSLALGLTLEGCMGVQVLETPGRTVHFDKELGFYWRQGGCWD